SGLLEGRCRWVAASPQRGGSGSRRDGGGSGVARAGGIAQRPSAARPVPPARVVPGSSPLAPTRRADLRANHWYRPTGDAAVLTTAGLEPARIECRLEE